MLSQTKGMMFIHLSVLVILLQVAVLSQGRSLRQRGKRLLYHPTEPNQYPVQNDYYYPQIDGQPIYLPPIGQSAEDMKELLDYYYNRNEAFVPEWTSAPPVDYNYEGIQAKYYEDSMSNGMVTEAFEEDHQGSFHVLPGTKQSILSPTVNHDKFYEYEDEFEDLDDYTPEVSSKTKHGSKKYTHKPNIPNTKSMLEYADEKDANTDEYYAPEIIAKFSKKTASENTKVQETESQVGYVDEKSKDTEEYDLPEKDANTDEYYAPEIVTKFSKRTASKHTNLKETESQVGYVDEKSKDTEEYDFPEIVERTNKIQVKPQMQKPKSELNHSSTEKIVTDEYYVPEKPEIVKIKKCKDKTNQKVKHVPEYLEDKYEAPSVHKVIKKGKLDNANKHQKDDSSTKIDHVSDEYYEQPTLIKSSTKENIKQNKKPNKGKRRKHTISKRYGMYTVDTLQTVTEKDAQIHDLESLELEHEFFEVKDETKPKLNLKDMSENEKKSYELKETPVYKDKVIETVPKEKVVIKTEPKEKPEGTKIVKTEPEMSEYEEIETEPEKPVKEKVVIQTEPKVKHERTKIVKTEPEMSEYEEIETEPKENPVKEKVVIKTKPKVKHEKTKIVKTEPEMSEYVEIETEPKENPVKEKVVIKTEPKVKHEKTKIVKTEPEMSEYEAIETEPKGKPVKEKVAIKTEPKVNHEKTKIVKTEPEMSEYEEIETEPKGKPVKVVIEKNPKEKHEKTKIVKTESEILEYEEIETVPKEKVVIKTEPKEKHEKTKIVKTEPKVSEYVTEQKEKVVVKTETKKPEKVVVKTKPKEKPEKVVVKTKSKEKPGKVKENVVAMTKPKENPEKVVIKTDSKENLYIQEYEDQKSKFNVEDEIADSEDPLEWQGSNDHISDFDSEEDIVESVFPDFEHSNNPSEALNIDESESDFENIGSGTVENGENPTNVQRLFPNSDSLKRLSSLNSNIWSLLFNPNAERNNFKKCTTRSNEAGHCTYIQHCDVPNIATSLEELLINACVMDDVFIGVCCPEFPVETVKVHWDQDTSNSDKQTEDEFVHSPDGELIVSWCDGYKKSLSNLLTSFSLTDCGIRSNEASKVQAWPWKAPLVSMSNGKIFCGGILINEEYVLTAAHCTTKIPRNQILVRLGQYNDSTGDDFAVVEIKRHAQYSPRTMHHDVALLKLGRRVSIDDFTGVICLPEEGDDEDEHEGEKALLLGWKGKFGTKSNSTEVLEVMDNKECRRKLRMNISSAVLCTEARNEDERTCNADSGAPLVIEDDGKYEVIGILSWNRNDCDQRFPSTFSRVSRYVEWIRKHAV